MQRDPVITVLTSVFNGEKFLPLAIESVLKQTFKDWEMVIVDDGSKDGTAKIVADYRQKYPDKIRYFYQENKGAAAARNNGLKEARGKYIAILDADDIALPERLAKQYEYLENHPEIVLVGSSVEIIDKDGLATGFKRKPIESALVKFYLSFVHNFACPIIHSTVVFRKHEALNLGGYDESFRYAHDFEFYARLAKKYELVNLPEVLIQFRHHAESIWGKRLQENKNPRDLFYDYVAEIIKRNVNYYLSVPEDKFEILKLLFMGETDSIPHLFIGLKIYGNFFDAFVKKEKFKEAEFKKIRDCFRKKRKDIVKSYFKKKYPLVKKIKDLLKR